MIFLIFWLGFAVLSAMAAERKGRSVAGWFVIGLVFGIFGLGAALIIAPAPKQS